MVIGVTSVVMLVSLGEGARRYFGDLFAGMGTNLVLVFPGRQDTRGVGMAITSTVQRLTLEDARAIERRGTSIARVNTILLGAGTLRHHNRQRDSRVVGTDEWLLEVHQLEVALGTFLSTEDVEARRRVVVIGRTLQQELFGDDHSPVGKMLRISDATFRGGCDGVEGPESRFRFRRHGLHSGDGGLRDVAADAVKR